MGGNSAQRPTRTGECSNANAAAVLVDKGAAARDGGVAGRSSPVQLDPFFAAHPPRLQPSRAWPAALTAIRLCAARDFATRPLSAMGKGFYGQLEPKES
ncbi:MAG TPA: hypothetical protein VGJ20_26655 [Xanthobacteraceae bacterium]|jgi:hypothetical protein